MKHEEKSKENKKIKIIKILACGTTKRTLTPIY